MVRRRSIVIVLAVLLLGGAVVQAARAPAEKPQPGQVRVAEVTVPVGFTVEEGQ